MGMRYRRIEDDQHIVGRVGNLRLQERLNLLEGRALDTCWHGCILQTETKIGWYTEQRNPVEKHIEKEPHTQVQDECQVMPKVVVFAMDCSGDRSCGRTTLQEDYTVVIAPNFGFGRKRRVILTDRYRFDEINATRRRCPIRGGVGFDIGLRSQRGDNWRSTPGTSETGTPRARSLVRHD
jgi:hypothetical protein